jgi:hypothetical protein
MGVGVLGVGMTAMVMPVVVAMAVVPALPVVVSVVVVLCHRVMP